MDNKTKKLIEATQILEGLVITGIKGGMIDEFAKSSFAAVVVIVAEALEEATGNKFGFETYQDLASKYLVQQSLNNPNITTEQKKEAKKLQAQLDEKLQWLM